MKSLITYWKEHPKFRVGARVVGVAVATYIVQAVRAEEVIEWRPFVDGLITATITAVFGVLGLEPFLGIKPDKIVVPAEQTIEK
jgi:hypothetical protein